MSNPNSFQLTEVVKTCVTRQNLKRKVVVEESDPPIVGEKLFGTRLTLGKFLSAYYNDEDRKHVYALIDGNSPFALLKIFTLDAFMGDYSDTGFFCFNELIRYHLKAVGLAIMSGVTQLKYTNLFKKPFQYIKDKECAYASNLDLFTLLFFSLYGDAEIKEVYKIAEDKNEFDDCLLSLKELLRGYRYKVTVKVSSREDIPNHNEGFRAVVHKPFKDTKFLYEMCSKVTGNHATDGFRSTDDTVQYVKEANEKIKFDFIPNVLASLDVVDDLCSTCLAFGAMLKIGGCQCSNLNKVLSRQSVNITQSDEEIDLQEKKSVEYIHNIVSDSTEYSNNIEHAQVFIDPYGHSQKDVVIQKVDKREVSKVMEFYKDKEICAYYDDNQSVMPPPEMDEDFDAVSDPPETLQTFLGKIRVAVNVKFSEYKSNLNAYFVSHHGSRLFDNIKGVSGCRSSYVFVIEDKEMHVLNRIKDQLMLLFGVKGENCYYFYGIPTVLPKVNTFFSFHTSVWNKLPGAVYSLPCYRHVACWGKYCDAADYKCWINGSKYLVFKVSQQGKGYDFALRAFKANSLQLVFDWQVLLYSFYMKDIANVVLPYYVKIILITCGFRFNGESFKNGRDVYHVDANIMIANNKETKMCERDWNDYLGWFLDFQFKMI